MSTAPSYADVHQRSITERDAYWAEQAKLIDWQTPPQRICNNDNAPFTRWFEGGTTNLCHNAVDRHLATRPDQNALIWVSTEVGQERVYSYRELHTEVQAMAAVLLSQGVDPIWLAMLITVNLQSSFLTPPFGWALFYLKGVAPPEVTIKDIYRGVVPFIAMQGVALTLVFFYPQIALWLPKAIGW